MSESKDRAAPRPSRGMYGGRHGALHIQPNLIKAPNVSMQTILPLPLDGRDRAFRATCNPNTNKVNKT